MPKPPRHTPLIEAPSFVKYFGSSAIHWLYLSNVLLIFVTEIAVKQNYVSSCLSDTTTSLFRLTQLMVQIVVYMMV